MDLLVSTSVLIGSPWARGRDFWALEMSNRQRKPKRYVNLQGTAIRFSNMNFWPSESSYMRCFCAAFETA